jgi:hypothetical protein
MNVLNRLLGLLVLLVVLAAALVTVGLVSGALPSPEVQQVWPYPPVLRVCHDVEHLPVRTRPWVLGGAIAALILSLLGLWRDLTPPPRRARLLALPGGGPGRTEMSYRTLDELAERSALEVAGIEHVRARVQPHKRALTVRCRARVSPYVNLATAGPDLERTIADRLHHVTGLPVRTVRVRTVVQKERARRRVR